MLAWGLGVVPSVGMGAGPLVSHNLIYQCSCKGERGSNRSSQVRTAWTHVTQNLPECLLFPALCVSVLSLPCACPGPASPTCLPPLTTAPISLWLFLGHHTRADGTFRKSALVMEGGFRYVGTMVPR